MRATRRTLLRFPLVMVVAGCAPSPVIVGAPGEVPEPQPPTRSDEAAAVATWVAGFAALMEEVALSASAWGAGDADVAWVSALHAQSAAHVSRLTAADPVSGGPTAFPTPSTGVNLSAGATTVTEALTEVSAEVTAGLPVLRAAFVSASRGQERLFQASLLVAVSASLAPALPPVEGGAGPAPFADPDVPESLTVALGHVRALIRGLELGLGRLQSSDEVRASGKERLDTARGLRNTILEGLSAGLPEVDTWELPTPMSTPEEIVAAWAVLETNLLDAFGVLVAADRLGAEDWLDSMLGQIDWVHRWGGRLPYWPGWVDTP